MNPRNAVIAVAVIAGLGCVLGWRSAYTSEAGRVEAASATVESFTIDAVHSKALFRVHHLGAGMFYGRFNDVTGTIVFDGASAAGPQFDVSIAAGSVDTGNDKLDGHLKSPDFFNVAEHPKLTFKSKSAKKVGDKTYEVSGDLTIHGVTKPLTAQVDWTGTAEGRGGKRCGFETVFTIKRSEFGMTYMIEGGGLGDEVRVIVSLEGMIGGGR
ncbi:MAG: Protein YceI [Phycisphaerae bacterium]|nr:Protein YceI [Phycisphaerae bacterium]